MGQELLSLQGVSKYYTSGSSVVMALSGVTLTFRAGEFVAITGESGSGKSTLAKIMAGILPYESGELLLAGQPTSHYDGADWERYRSHAISFISQSYDILPGCTVLRNVVSALHLTGMEKEEATVRAEEILRQVELWDLRNRRAAKLSSGQKQRLSIARALAKPAPILIADEPTGNLDSENSAKIIQLLAAAARDRLVLMVTHDFEEAAAMATRRITIQDGTVAADVTLRDRESPESTLPAPKRDVRSRGLSLYTAGLQVSSRPVWTGMMAAFFALTAFAVFAFLGTFLVNLDDTPTRLYDNAAFRNGAQERIVVVQPNGESLTEEDLNALLAIAHVTAAERYGYIRDINYFYREGIDYNAHYVAAGGSAFTDNTEVVSQVTLEGTTLFLETVPALTDSTHFLTAGRLPETAYEVVAGDESLLGQTIPVYIQDTKNWNRTAYIALEVTVVGTTDYGRHLYFSEELARGISCYMRHNATLPLPSDAVETGSFLCAEAMAAFFEQSIDKGEGSSSVFESFGTVTDTMELEYAGTHHLSTFNHTIAVSPETFEQMVDGDFGPQVSLTIENYAYTEAVLTAVRAQGYGALSPYQMGSNKQDAALAAERMQTLKICLLALFAVVALQIVVLRAMFSMETDTYRLLANLGLRRKHAGRSIYWQMIGFALGGEGIAALAVALCQTMGVARIVSILHYLPVPYLFLLWGVHFTASILVAVWVAHALRRQVYPASGVGADLAMDEEVLA